MASFWDEIGKDRARRRRRRRQVEAWNARERAAGQRPAAREATTSARTQRAEEARARLETGLAEAERRKAALAEELHTLSDVLRAVLALPARTLDALRDEVPAVAFRAPPVEPRPSWSDFVPPEPASLFGRRKYEKAVTAAQAEYDRAYRDHERRRAEADAAARREHAERVSGVHQEHERRWDAIQAGVDRLDPDSVIELAGAIVHALTPLAGLLSGGRAEYQPEPREAVLEIELPDTDVIPRERTWVYNRAEREVQSRPRPDKETARLYADLVSRITLAVADACFKGIDPQVMGALTINGIVPTIDPATGRDDRPCIITVTVDRSTYDELVLERLTPARCMGFLGAEMSKHPYELEPVEPFVDFEHLRKYRLDSAHVALTEVDYREDLLQMDPYKFETLVEDLFIAMGYEAWRTTSSRDDGIDAVVVDRRRLLPIECVVQAKRTRNSVEPKDVQALIGAMAESGTATHGALVTTSWLSDRSRRRARAKNIVTIQNAELVGLIEKHLGRKVVISVRPPGS